MINNLLRQDLNENLTKNKTELDKTIWEKNLRNFLESFYKLFTISRKHLFQLKKIPGVFQVFLIILSVLQVKSQKQSLFQDFQVPYEPCVQRCLLKGQMMNRGSLVKGTGDKENK